jgi:hypothetical protein
MNDFDGLTAAEERQLRVIARTMGERAACRELGIPRATFARLLAGLPVRRGTVALLRSRLNAPEAPDDAA